MKFIQTIQQIEYGALVLPFGSVQFHSNSHVTKLVCAREVIEHLNTLLLFRIVSRI